MPYPGGACDPGPFAFIEFTRALVDNGGHGTGRAAEDGQRRPPDPRPSNCWSSWSWWSPPWCSRNGSTRGPISRRAGRRPGWRWPWPTTAADSPQLSWPALRTEDRAPPPPAMGRTGSRRDTGTDFVVVMFAGGSPLHPSGPQPDRWPLPRARSPRRSRARATSLEQFTGTLGPSVRVDRAGGRRRQRRGGRWSPSGLTTTKIGLGSIAGPQSGGHRDRRRRWCWAIGASGAWAISRRLSRQTHGLGAARRSPGCTTTTAPSCTPSAKVSVLLDRDGRVQLVNDEARELLALPLDVGRAPGSRVSMYCRSRWSTACSPTARSGSGTRSTWWGTEDARDQQKVLPPRRAGWSDP